MPRHLPVIRDPAPEDAEAAARPVWHWPLIGAGLTVTLWAPLVILVSRLGPAAVLIAFSLAALAGGALVGRFGGRAGSRQGALGGLLAALCVLLLSWASGVTLPSSVALAALGALAVSGGLGGWAGSAWGIRKRPC